MIKEDGMGWDGKGRDGTGYFDKIEKNSSFNSGDLFQLCTLIIQSTDYPSLRKFIDNYHFIP